MQQVSLKGSEVDLVKKKKRCRVNLLFSETKESPFKYEAWNGDIPSDKRS